MKYSNEMMFMIAQFLYGEYGAVDFSFDFPARLSHVYDDFRSENQVLCDLLEEDMPEICGYFDPRGTGAPLTYGETKFREKVAEIYQQAIPHASSRRIS